MKDAFIRVWCGVLMFMCGGAVFIGATTGWKASTTMAVIWAVCTLGLLALGPKKELSAVDRMPYQDALCDLFAKKLEELKSNLPSEGIGAAGAQEQGGVRDTPSRLEFRAAGGRDVVTGEVRTWAYGTRIAVTVLENPVVGFVGMLVASDDGSGFVLPGDRPDVVAGDKGLIEFVKSQPREDGMIPSPLGFWKFHKE